MTENVTYYDKHVSLQKCIFCSAYQCERVERLGGTEMQNHDSHTYDVVEVFHNITKIITTELSTSTMINRASWKCFRQG